MSHLVRIDTPQPSWKSGFARHGDSVHPDLWKGVIGYWAHGLGATGKTVYDISGRGNDGTFGSAMLLSDWRSDDNREYLDYRGGANQYVDLGTDPKLVNLPTTYNFTISMWIRRDDANNLDGCFAWSGTDDLVIYANDNVAGSGGLRVFWRDLGGDIMSESGPNLAIEWHLTTFLSRASNDHEGYRDGISVGTSSDTGTAGPFSNVFLGAFGPTTQNMNGRIDDVIVWDHALPTAKIQKLYEIGRGGMLQLKPPVVSKTPEAAGTTSPWYQYQQQLAGAV